MGALCTSQKRPQVTPWVCVCRNLLVWHSLVRNLLHRALLVTFGSISRVYSARVRTRIYALVLAWLPPEGFFFILTTLFCSDLASKVQWALDNDKIAKQIADVSGA